MLREGIHECVKNLNPIEFELATGDRVLLTINGISISNPRVPEAYIYTNNRQIYPTECRQRKISYGGMCNVEIGIKLNDMPKSSINVDLGNIPIMIKVEFLLFIQSNLFYTYIFDSSLPDAI